MEGIHETHHDNRAPVRCTRVCLFVMPCLLRLPTKGPTCLHLRQSYCTMCAGQHSSDCEQAFGYCVRGNVLNPDATESRFNVWSDRTPSGSLRYRRKIIYVCCGLLSITDACRRLRLLRVALVPRQRASPRASCAMPRSRCVQDRGN